MREPPPCRERRLADPTVAIVKWDGDMETFVDDDGRPHDTVDGEGPAVTLREAQRSAPRCVDPRRDAPGKTRRCPQIARRRVRHGSVRCWRHVRSLPARACRSSVTQPALWSPWSDSKQADAPPAPPLPASVFRRRRETAPVLDRRSEGDRCACDWRVSSGCGSGGSRHRCRTGAPPAALTGCGRRWGMRACLHRRAPDK